MRTIVKGKNVDVPAADREYATTKLGRLERLLGDRTDALVELSTEAHRSPDNRQIVEVTLVIDGRTVRGGASAPSHRAAIDDVVDKLERRAVTYKQRPLTHRRETSRSHPAPSDGEPPREEPADERSPQIVKTKRFAIEPMFEEDAVSRMGELGHSFFVFVNAETEQLAVLYRRRDGDYGLIEAQIEGAYTGGNRRRPTRPRGG